MKQCIFLLLLAGTLISGCSYRQESLVGLWTLTAYGSEGSSTPVVADSQASIRFSEDEILNGNSGCNGFSGEYKTDGSEITFSSLVSTAMACEEPLLSQEGTVYGVLSGTASYKIHGNTLTITNRGTELVFTSSQGQ